MAKGDERRVEDAFVAYLEREGWTIQRQAAFCDVHATRGNDELFAEVKGHTGNSMNLDLDTMFGQLLRRMASKDARYAVVVPSEAVAGVARVPSWVRDALRIVVYEVRLDDGSVVRRSDV